MSSPDPMAAFWRGVKNTVPFFVVLVPFAMLFGVVGTEAGLNLFEVLAFSVLVIAGAAQFTAVQLMTDNAPTIIVILTALAVNLRMAMYSAALVPHLGAARLRTRALAAYLLFDQPFALASAEYERRPAMTTAEKMAYFFGAGLPLAPVWYATTLAGALIGKSIPESYALDFAVPITFLALVAPMLRSVPHIVAAMVAIVASLVFSVIPYNGGLILSAMLAMATGAEVERRMGRQP